MKHLRTYIILLLAFFTAIASEAQSVLTLQEAIESACRNNADLQKKRMTTESMAQLKKELYTKYFPSVSATGTAFMRNRGFAEGSELLDMVFSVVAAVEDVSSDADIEDVQILKYGFMGSLKVVQPIYTGGRLTSANRLAKLGEEASREFTALKEEELTQEVEKYFWQLVQLYEADRSLLTMDSLVEKARHDASLALKAGLVTANDKMEVDLHASDLDRLRLQVDNGKKLCREYLAYLVGTDRVDSVVWDDIYTVEDPSKYLTDPTVALQNRHETKLLQMKTDAAKLKRKYTLGTLLPAVGAAFTLDYHKFSAKRDAKLFHSIFDNRPWSWMLAAVIKVPISDWWGGKYKLRRSNIAIRQSEIDYDDKQKLMRVQMSQKWNTLTEKYQQIDVARKQLLQSEQNQKQHASAYRSGSSTMTDRLHADALYEKARTNYIDACIKYRLAITDYMHATGRSQGE